MAWVPSSEGVEEWQADATSQPPKKLSLAEQIAATRAQEAAKAREAAGAKISAWITVSGASSPGPEQLGERSESNKSAALVLCIGGV